MIALLSSSRNLRENSMRTISKAAVMMAFAATIFSASAEASSFSVTYGTGHSYRNRHDNHHDRRPHHGGHGYYHPPRPAYYGFHGSPWRRAYYNHRPYRQVYIYIPAVPAPQPTPVNYSYSYNMPAPSGDYCREYQAVSVIGGQPQQSYGQACLQPDGSWKILN